MADIVPTAIGLKPKQAIDFLRQKIAVPSEHWTDIWKEAHARSFMVAGAASQALVEDFHAEVIRAIENGTTLADFRKQFDRLVEKHGWVHNGSPGWRAQIIYETNLSMAYSAGQYAQMTEPATLRVFPYWQYVHTTSQHPRVQHEAWAGLVLRADDPWWDTHYPPNGWRCKCGVRPVMRSELAGMGRDGPDTAPEITTRAWTNPHTGEVHQVPIGIDPGFDYNVGKAGLAAAPPDGPVGGPPAARRPATPRPAAIDGGGLAVQPPDDAGEPDAAGAGLRPARDGMGEAVVRRRLAVPKPVAADYAEWLKQVEAGRAHGTGWVIGALPDSVAAALSEGGAASDGPNDVVLPAKAATRLLAGTKAGGGTALSAAEVVALERGIAHPLKILRRRGDLGRRVVFVFHPQPAHPQRVPGKLGRIVVAIGRQITLDGVRQRRNAVVGAGLVAPDNLSDREYETLWDNR